MQAAETGPRTFITEDPQVRLQFVERAVSDGTNVRLVRILQQLWVITEHGLGLGGAPMPLAQRAEWRDVPCVTEQADGGR